MFNARYFVDSSMIFLTISYFINTATNVALQESNCQYGFSFISIGVLAAFNVITFETGSAEMGRLWLGIRWVKSASF